jgi:hypothetical protein
MKIWQNTPTWGIFIKGKQELLFVLLQVGMSTYFTIKS